MEISPRVIYGQERVLRRRRGAISVKLVFYLYISIPNHASIPSTSCNNVH
jgi:hypothetical protein